MTLNSRRDSFRLFRKGISHQSQHLYKINETNPKKKIKNCCRKTAEFMCTQVGVGGLVVSYAIFGSFVFMELEGERPKVYEDIKKLRNSTLEQLWKVTYEDNILNQLHWSHVVNETVMIYQARIVSAIKNGYDPTLIEQDQIWSFAVALMFCLSVFTMIGYGRYVPKTDWGKVATMIYALFGIPLIVLYLLNMGKILARAFKYLYTKLYFCQLRKNQMSQNHMEQSTHNARNISSEDYKHFKRHENSISEVIVPSTACLWVMISYIASGTILFAEWEDWSYLDSTYFCATSLLKIGFGDFVPGATGYGIEAESQTKLVINFIFLLLGIGLLAMCYNLMKEEVGIKVNAIEEYVKEKLCFYGRKYNENP